MLGGDSLELRREAAFLELRLHVGGSFERLGRELRFCLLLWELHHGT